MTQLGELICPRRMPMTQTMVQQGNKELEKQHTKAFSDILLFQSHDSLRSTVIR